MASVLLHVASEGVRLDKARLRELLPFPPLQRDTIVSDVKKMLTKENVKTVVRRGALLWFALSMAAAWAVAITYGPPGHIYKGLSKLGQGVPTHPKYGLDPTKLAVIFSSEPEGYLAAHLLQMSMTIPYAWPLLYIGTDESISRLKDSHGIRMATEKGKLTLEVAPEWIDMRSPGNVSMHLGSEDFYDALPPSVEWLFVAGTDAVLCSNSMMTMNDWLDFDWIGRPWDAEDLQSGGGNGFSLRRISAVRRTLRSMRRLTFPIDDSALMAAIRKDTSTPMSAITDISFVMENVYIDRPMAVHLPTSDVMTAGDPWNRTEIRKSVLTHCPEIKTIANMKTFWERCPEGQHNGTSRGRPSDRW